MFSLRLSVAVFFTVCAFARAFCPPGEEQIPPSEDCHVCPINTFKSNVGPGPCQPCPPNSLSPSGAVSCFSCPPNQAILSNGRCGTCPPGTRYIGIIQECYMCFPGSFNDKPNLSERCQDCPENSFSGVRSSRCFPCPPGKFYSGDTKSCVDCQPGSFYNEANLRCEPCSVNRISTTTNEESCKFCEKGTFARPGSTSCFKCPANKVYLKESDSCGDCPAGFYSDFTASCLRFRSMLGR